MSPEPRSAMTESGIGSTASQLKREIGFAQFGDLALKSKDLYQTLTEACRIAADVLETDSAKVI